MRLASRSMGFGTSPMAEPHLFILAGESSGDRIGGALLADLRARGAFSVSGVGGEEMARHGVVSLFPMSDLAVMGYADVVKRLPLLLWRLSQVTRAILRDKPDLVVLIDAQVFSQTIARRLRKRGYTGTILLYVAPAVWAYHPERAKAIRPLFDEVLSVLPFEPDIMRQLEGPPTVYVGHPALARFPDRGSGPERGDLMLMPGSRTGELRRHLPMMRVLAHALAGHTAITGIVIPTPASLQDHLRRSIADWTVPVRILVSEQDRRSGLASAIAAFAVSGTATLELALAGVPHAITYIAEPRQVTLFENGRTPWIGLPNIVAGRGIVPEILFAGTGDPARALAAMSDLLDSGPARQAQRQAFASMRQLMETGESSDPRSDPAERVARYLFGQN